MTLKRISIFLILLLALDFASKKWALASIPHIQWNDPYPFGGIALFSYGISCSFNTAFNTGAAWGLFPGHSGLLFALRSVIIIGLVVYLFRQPRPKLSLWLITVGAIGNAIDYFAYGFVVDFIHFNFWGYTFPIFNLADSYISIGALWLFLTPQKHANPNLKPQE